jgi:type IV pilus assembly protein PilM
MSLRTWLWEASVAMGLDGLLNSLRGKGGLSSITSKLATSLTPKGSTGLAKGGLSPIAIDFGAGSLKILQLTGGEPHALAAAASLETPSNLLHDHKRRLELQVQALPKLIKQGNFKGKRAVCAIPTWDTVCKHVPVGGVVTKQTIDAAIAQHFTDYSTAFAYKSIEAPSELRGKGDVLVLASKRDLIHRLMDALVNARLEPVGMQAEMLCTMQSFDHLRKREGDLIQNVLFVDLGAWTTKAMITRAGSLVAARIIPVGGYHLDELISKQIASTFEDARKARLATDTTVERRLVVEKHQSTASDPADDRRRVDTPPGFSGDVLQQPAVAVGPPGSDLREPLEMLTDDIRLLVRYFGAQWDGQRLDRVVFSGGESRHRGLAQHLAKQLRLPAQVGDPTARLARSGTEATVGVDFSQSQPGWAAALGLCLAPTDL